MKEYNSGFVLCNKCNTEKGRAAFYKDRSKKNGHHSVCRSCTLNDKKKYYRQNTEAHINRNMKRWYGITFTDYKKMNEDRNGVCDICKEVPANNEYRLCVDHCHKTGKVRGLLCQKCNHGLGSYRDSVKLLNSAILYLTNHLETKQEDL